MPHDNSFIAQTLSQPTATFNLRCNSFSASVLSLYSYPNQRATVRQQAISQIILPQGNLSCSDWLMAIG